MTFDEWWNDNGIELASEIEKAAARKGFAAGAASRDAEIAELKAVSDHNLQVYQGAAAVFDTAKRL